MAGKRSMQKRRKTDPTKVRMRMATRLIAETVLTIGMDACRLHMGSRHTLANCLRG